MAYALISGGHALAASSDGNGATTGSIDTTGADLIVIIGGFATGVTMTLSDSKTNTWTSIRTQVAPNFETEQMWYAQAPTVGSGHTFTLSGTSGTPSIAVLAFSGSVASPLDQQNSAQAFQPGSVTPGFDNEVLVCGVQGLWGATAPSAIDQSFTLVDSTPSASSHTGVASAYLIETTATAKNPTWSGASGSFDATSMIVTFKASGGGGFTALNRRTFGPRVGSRSA